MSEEPQYVKVHVTLSGDGGPNGESMWATRVKGDLYEVQNIPFFAYGIHPHDVVRAVPKNGYPLEVVSVERRGGHQTLRVIFKKELLEESQKEIIAGLRKHGAHIERAMSHFWALSIPADGNFDGAFNFLEALEEDGILAFETTGETREGTFDAPKEEE